MMILKDLIHTCENCDILYIYKVHDNVLSTSFDPIDDTDLVFYQDALDLYAIPDEYLYAEVRLWSMTDVFCIKVCI